jgi:hypothetical protein
MTLRSFAVASALTFSVATPVAMPAFAASPVVTSSHAVSQRAVPKGTALGARADEARYASREAASPEARKYRGGDVIVISATALVIVLLVVLIIVLI